MEKDGTFSVYSSLFSRDLFYFAEIMGRNSAFQEIFIAHLMKRGIHVKVLARRASRHPMDAHFLEKFE